MTLMTAHRILIATATAFFAFYGAWEIAHRGDPGGAGGMTRGSASFLAAAILGIYLRSLRRRPDRPARGDEGEAP